MTENESACPAGTNLSLMALKPPALGAEGGLRQHLHSQDVELRLPKASFISRIYLFEIQ